ncbi:basic proline-rich protein-like, partial [Ovis aries]|uniref:basic proline-rich protein-like n=1 Tax=Ovis aries TaxID=9940 RepID=UPI00295264CC
AVCRWWGLPCVPGLPPAQLRAAAPAPAACPGAGAPWPPWAGGAAPPRGARPPASFGSALLGWRRVRLRPARSPLLRGPLWPGCWRAAALPGRALPRLPPLASFPGRRGCARLARALAPSCPPLRSCLPCTSAPGVLGRASGPVACPLPGLRGALCVAGPGSCRAPPAVAWPPAPRCPACPGSRVLAGVCRPPPGGCLLGARRCLPRRFPRALLPSRPCAAGWGLPCVPGSRPPPTPGPAPAPACGGASAPLEPREAAGRRASSRPRGRPASFGSPSLAGARAPPGRRLPLCSAPALAALLARAALPWARLARLASRSASFPAGAGCARLGAALAPSCPPLRSCLAFALAPGVLGRASGPVACPCPGSRPELCVRGQGSCRAPPPLLGRPPPRCPACPGSPGPGWGLPPHPAAASLGAPPLLPPSLPRALSPAAPCAAGWGLPCVPGLPARPLRAPPCAALPAAPRAPLAAACRLAGRRASSREPGAPPRLAPALLGWRRVRLPAGRAPALLRARSGALLARLLCLGAPCPDLLPLGFLPGRRRLRAAGRPPGAFLPPLRSCLAFAPRPRRPWGGLRGRWLAPCPGSRGALCVRAGGLVPGSSRRCLAPRSALPGVPRLPGPWLGSAPPPRRLPPGRPPLPPPVASLALSSPRAVCRWLGPAPACLAAPAPLRARRPCAPPAGGARAPLAARAPAGAAASSRAAGAPPRLARLLGWRRVRLPAGRAPALLRALPLARRLLCPGAPCPALPPARLPSPEGSCARLGPPWRLPALRRSCLAFALGPASLGRAGAGGLPCPGLPPAALCVRAGRARAGLLQPLLGRPASALHGVPRLPGPWLGSAPPPAAASLGPAASPPSLPSRSLPPRRVQLEAQRAPPWPPRARLAGRRASSRAAEAPSLVWLKPSLAGAECASRAAELPLCSEARSGSVAGARLLCPGRALPRLASSSASFPGRRRLRAAGRRPWRLPALSSAPALPLHLGPRRPGAGFGAGGLPPAKGSRRPRSVCAPARARAGLLQPLLGRPASALPGVPPAPRVPGWGLPPPPGGCLPGRPAAASPPSLPSRSPPRSDVCRCSASFPAGAGCARLGDAPGAFLPSAPLLPCLCPSAPGVLGAGFGAGGLPPAPGSAGRALCARRPGLVPGSSRRCLAAQTPRCPACPRLPGSLAGVCRPPTRRLPPWAPRRCLHP